MKDRPISRRNLLGKITAGSLAAATGSVLPWSDFARAQSASHWSYEGPQGPASWGRLSPDFVACGRGQRQSPIDLAEAGLDTASDLSLAWQPFKGIVENNGHTLQVLPTDNNGSALSLGGKKYAFLQFHFHHPSEHVVNGGRWPLEVHMMHKAEAGDLAMTSILFRPGRENDVLGRILADAPALKAKATLTQALDMDRFLPTSHATYRYAGSLTTPPCSEIVSWIVFREPVEAAIGQIQRFAQIFPMNARPLQRLFQRDIALDLF